jgi:PEP-CTERM motif
MNSSRNPRFLRSSFTAALLAFAWTGTSQADLWVAQGTDSMGQTVSIDLNVVSTIIGTDTGPANQFMFSITNNSSLKAEAMSDIVISTNTSLAFDTSIMTSGVMMDWTSAFTSNSPDFTLTLTSKHMDATDTIASNSSVLDGLTIVTKSGGDLGAEINGLKVSMVSDPHEITASLAVPEPSSLVIAAFGALGFLGYSLRRQKVSAC